MQRRLMDDVERRLQQGLPDTEVQREVTVTTEDGTRRYVDFVFEWNNMLYVIEVKPYTRAQIRSANIQNWDLTNFSVKDLQFSPITQARMYLQAILAEYQNSLRGYAVVLLPNITARDWETKTRDSNLINYLIFKDEIESPDKLLEKLSFISNSLSTPDIPPIYPSRKDYKIFVSYRRTDSKWTAGRLADRLKKEYKDSNVFFDIYDIHGGEDWKEVLEDNIKSSSVLIVVIGSTWLTVSHEDSGKRRLDDTQDFVRLEYARAVEHNLEIIPVCIDGAMFPTNKKHLPTNLRSLPDKQKVDLRFEDFEHDCNRIIAAINRFLV